MIEFESYSKNRKEGLKRIMGYACTSQREIAGKTTQFSSNQQLNFPVHDISEGIIKISKSKEEEQKVEEFEDIEKLD